jgi:hypothetical protein
MCFGRRGWVGNLMNYQIMGWVGVHYGGIRGLEVAASMHVCSVVALRGV